MKRGIVLLFAVLLVLLVAPLCASPEPDADERKANRARLDQARQHPDEFARLQRDARAFLALPEERRQQVLKLDRDLNANGVPSTAHWRAVLERYVRWLERLPEQDRHAIDLAPDAGTRLAVIRTLRDREWMQTQPRAIRERWQRLNAPEQTAFVRNLRRDEQQHRHEWQMAARFWKELETKQPLPARLADLDARDKEGTVQTLVKDYLLPMLRPAEKERLEKAEGHWPAYPQALVAIASRHPFALPGPEGPRYFHELPQALQTRFTSAKTKEPNKAIKSHEGKWPAFAIAVVEVNLRRPKFTPLPHELWACNYQSLLKPMQQYVDDVLRPALTADEQLRLLHASDKWPKYPVTIHELAQAHQLRPPPWQTALPGPPARWDNYRMRSPLEWPRRTENPGPRS